ncbi:MAG: DUF3472 domain-containing protein [Chitinophagaceae bacterium]|nr:DUF3472 domain-containing protein [Chitinophagaceae bacterium]
MKPKIPFGIISIEHSWPANASYLKQSFALEVEYEPRITASYFWAQQFWFHGGDGGYFGIQSDGDINGTRQKIAIFSIWKSVGATRSDQANSSAESFGHEGSGYSCKIPFEWKEGIVYKLELVRKFSADEGKNSWQAHIIDTSSKISFLIGTINVPLEWGNLQPKSNFFIEYFRAVASCQNVPYEKSVYSNPVMIEYTEIHPNSSNHKTYGECSSIGKISNQGNTFAIETGKIY